ncbi:hypothetical protein AcW1_004455 [Taiwanofungus camphoratus]|nr:hypothetical protein AcV5_000829 [Antrodia cinnamomea]KAI0952323.1 hypothetical protein AcV7_008170 [Antrodia cinnamomea]KAI0959706.1 hypothetical protein AcW1_004455 [Antrodia cinnamomea]
MLAPATVLLAFAASSLAYTITSPTNSSGWTTSGPNTVSWTKVSTDPVNFTVVLSNQQVYPPVQQVLDALVVGSDSSTVVNPPSGGWVAGTGYQVNLVQDPTHLDSILAQSQQFSIAQTTSSTFSSSFSTASSASASTQSLSNAASSGLSSSASSPSSGNTGALNPTSSDTSTSPTSSNAAAPAMGVQASVFSLLALLGVALA